MASDRITVKEFRELEKKEGKRPRKQRPDSEFGSLIKQGTEDEIQALFIKWVRLHEDKFPELKLLHSIPNSSGFRGRAVRAVLWLTGLRQGILDIHLPIAHLMGNSPLKQVWYIGLWIEFKSETGVVSPEQKLMIARLQKAGHRVEIHRSWVTGANAVIDYLDLPLEKFSEQRNDT